MDKRKIISVLLIFVIGICLVAGCTSEGDEAYYHDEYLFFSGIKIGMNKDETVASVKDSGWFGDALDITEGIETSVTDISHTMKNGDTVVPVAEFNEDGMVNIIGAVIQLSGKENAEDAFRTYYDLFVNMYNLKDYKKTVNEDEPYLDGAGYMYAVSDEHRYEALGYEMGDECYCFWTDEENRIGYGFYKMFYTHSEDTVRYPDEYHIGVVMFNMNK